MKELKDNELNAVTGGDDGDSKKEKADTPESVKFLYEVGAKVEVYKTGVHISTESATIIERKAIQRGSGCNYGFVGYYRVQYDSGKSEWIVANKIEST